MAALGGGPLANRPDARREAAAPSDLQQHVRPWRHVFKLDPDSTLSDDHVYEVCRSGTDAIMVGGSSGVTYAKTAALLERIRRHEIPCALEVSEPSAIVPGFDYYFVPMVLNAPSAEWIVGHHHRVLKQLGTALPWEKLIPQAYLILNPASTAARITEARTELDPDDLKAYTDLAARLFHFPIIYIEYSGIFGRMDKLSAVCDHLQSIGPHRPRLFYGGGIDNAERACEAGQWADTLVVGNAVYDNLRAALETVKVKH